MYIYIFVKCLISIHIKVFVYTIYSLPFIYTETLFTPQNMLYMVNEIAIYLFIETYIDVRANLRTALRSI